MLKAAAVRGDVPAVWLNGRLRFSETTLATWALPTSATHRARHGVPGKRFATARSTPMVKQKHLHRQMATQHLRGRPTRNP